MVSLTVSTVLVALVMGAVVMQTRVSAAVGNYELMNRTGAIALRRFESDMRQARNLLPTSSFTNGYDPARINMEIVTGVDADGKVVRDTVAYIYDAATGRLYREQPIGSGRTTLLTGLSSCRFCYFGLNDNPLPSTANPTPSSRELRKVLISGSLSTPGVPVGNTDGALSSVVVLRRPN